MVSIFCDQLDGECFYGICSNCVYNPEMQNVKLSKASIAKTNKTISEALKKADNGRDIMDDLKNEYYELKNKIEILEAFLSTNPTLDSIMQNVIDDQLYYMRNYRDCLTFRCTLLHIPIE